MWKRFKVILFTFVCSFIGKLKKGFFRLCVALLQLLFYPEHDGEFEMLKLFSKQRKSPIQLKWKTNLFLVSTTFRNRWTIYKFTFFLLFDSLLRSLNTSKCAGMIASTYIASEILRQIMKNIIFIIDFDEYFCVKINFIIYFMIKKSLFAILKQ